MPVFNLSALRKLIEDENLFLIPVSNDGKKTPKTKWRSDDSKIHGLLALQDLMFKYETDFIAIKCGKSSENLVCIDVDTKHYAGFDSTILNDFNKLYPDILEKMRIERTPSGGLHFLYKVGVSGIVGDDHVRVNRCVAYRPASADELLSRPDLEKYGFIEIKDEGGLCTSFPSPGYTRIKNELGWLTEEQHYCIVNQCMLYNQCIKKVEIREKREFSNDKYIEGKNPFACFNDGAECSEVLKDCGWSFYKSSGKFDWYSKPGGDPKVCSGTYNRETNIYRIFTTNSGVDDKFYNPASLLGAIKHGGRYADLYKELVEKGYGKIKTSIEKRMLVKGDGKADPNISEESKTWFANYKANLNDKYPFGTFWDVGDDGGLRINREKFLRVCDEIGFKKGGYGKNKGVTCYVEYGSWSVKNVDDDFVFRKMKSYIINGLEKEDEGIDVLDCYEGFLQNHGKFTITRFEVFDETLIFKSTKDTSYKFFKNCYVVITKDGANICSYDEILELGKLVFADSIQDREFLRVEGQRNGLYHLFVQNAIGWTEYLEKCIGYLAHEYRDEEGYFIYGLEKCENPKDGGGSGKNVFFKLLSLTSTYKSVAASLVKKDNNLLQSWDYQKIMCLSDIPQRYDLIFFKDLITDGATVNKKYVNEFSVDVHDMCKLIGTGNYSFDNTDPGLERRIRQVEFTDYYTKLGGVNKVHGKMFPKDWVENDFLEYDNIMIDCIVAFLKGGGWIEKIKLSDTGWIKQFDEKYYTLRDFIKIHFDDWVKEKYVVSDRIAELYKLYCYTNNIKKPASPTRVNKAISDYCENQRVKFKTNYSYKGINCKKFWLLGDLEELEQREEVNVIEEDMPF